jgi:hypothetical protein
MRSVFTFLHYIQQIYSLQVPYQTNLDENGGNDYFLDNSLINIYFNIYIYIYKAPFVITAPYYDAKNNEKLKSFVEYRCFVNRDNLVEDSVLVEALKCYWYSFFYTCQRLGFKVDELLL